MRTLELLLLSVSSSDLHFCEFCNYITTAEHTHILEINVLGVYIKMFLLVCIYNQDTLGFPGGAVVESLPCKVGTWV